MPKCQYANMPICQYANTMEIMSDSNKRLTSLRPSPPPLQRVFPYPPTSSHPPPPPRLFHPTPPLRATRVEVSRVTSLRWLEAKCTESHAPSLPLSTPRSRTTPCRRRRTPSRPPPATWRVMIGFRAHDFMKIVCADIGLRHISKRKYRGRTLVASSTSE